MASDDLRLTIGELARRTGLSVRTIRFWSDEGLVPPTARTDAGYRLFDAEALARLELVRTLRDLGVELDAVRRVLAREATLAEVAATHAAALDAQIRMLRLRRAVLGAAARSGQTARELNLVHRLARLSDEERRRIVDDFLDEAFAGLDLDPGFVARMRAGRPELPDDPTPEQVAAWVDLAELLRDDGFRRTIRDMAERQAADRAAGGGGGAGSMAAAQAVAEEAGAALAGGVDAASAAGRAVAVRLAARFAADGEDAADPAFRARLAERLAAGTDERAERYWQLLAVINGWPPVPTVTPAWRWLAAALRASA